MDDICKVCGCLGYVLPTEKSPTGFFCPECYEALEIAKFFHETYERLAPRFGYETRRDSSKPWPDVPEKNRRLMVATVKIVLSAVRSEENRLREVLTMVRDHLELTSSTCSACRRGYAYVADELGDRPVEKSQAEQIRDLADETDNLLAPMFGRTKWREVTWRLRQLADLLERLGKPCFADPDDLHPCREVDSSRGTCQTLEEGGSWVECDYGGQYNPPLEPESPESPGIDEIAKDVARALGDEEG